MKQTNKTETKQTMMTTKCISNARNTAIAALATLSMLAIGSTALAEGAKTSSTGAKTATKNVPRASEAVSSKVSGGKSLPAALKKMQEKYASAKTLTTQFVQRQKSIALGTTKESSGRIYFKRPDRFRWETHEPASSASILVSNGKKVWYYTPPSRPQGKGQVMVRRAADVQSRLAMDLLAGSANLHKDFRVKEQGPDRFELTPLKPAGDIEHIELFVERPTNLVYKLILFTTIGNETQLELKNVELGPELKDAMFNFVPPENTEEIH